MHCHCKTRLDVGKQCFHLKQAATLWPRAAADRACARDQVREAETPKAYRIILVQMGVGGGRSLQFANSAFSRAIQSIKGDAS